MRRAAERSAAHRRAGQRGAMGVLTLVRSLFGSLLTTSVSVIPTVTIGRYQLRQPPRHATPTTRLRTSFMDCSQRYPLPLANRAPPIDWPNWILLSANQLELLRWRYWAVTPVARALHFRRRSPSRRLGFQALDSDARRSARLVPKLLSIFSPAGRDVHRTGPLGCRIYRQRKRDLCPTRPKFAYGSHARGCLDCPME
jgi:hypothetical protein